MSKEGKKWNKGNVKKDHSTRCAQHQLPPASYSSTAVVTVVPSQYSTHPSRSKVLMTVLNWGILTSDPSQLALRTLDDTAFPAPAGYSMWKTGLPAAMKGWKSAHSSLATHSSLTENCTTGRTSSTMDPAFLSPTAMLWLAASAARNLTKSTESDSLRLRPLSLSCQHR